MEKALFTQYTSILKSELIPAFGCTEPIAIAYASAKARLALGTMPSAMTLRCSGNMIKNAKSVVVPNSGGQKGIIIAAVLGVLGGNSDEGLEVLQGITAEHVEHAKKLIREGFCQYCIEPGVSKLYIAATVYGGCHSAEVVIEDKHTRITSIKKDGIPEYPWQALHNDHIECVDKNILTVQNILEYANVVDLDEVCEPIKRQIDYNSAISREGLANNYGAEVGKTLLKVYGNDIKVRAKASAAAGSDARMSGCELPVVINSGSGNQGITVSLPVIEYARELGVSEEKLYRALIVSNLTAIHLKKFIGILSAYCGAVSAACGCGAGITYLYGCGYEEISDTIVNTLANVSGIVCDGAKPSCAAKIASAVDAAILAHHLTVRRKTFQPGDGLVKDSVENTIESICRMAREGMKSTDTEILKIMVEQ